MSDLFALELPQTMFCADAAIKLCNDLIHDAVHFTFRTCDEAGVLFGIKHGDVVMDVSIADMTESDDA